MAAAMSMRKILTGSALFALTACWQPPEGSAEPEGTPLACALDGSEELEKRCVVEVVPGADGQTYVLHRPDGGFRRVRIDGEGRYVAADGADAVSESETGEGTVLRIADETYLIPLSDEPLGMYD